MPTYTYDERVSVAKAMETTGSATCPRCGASVAQHRLQTTQDKLLKRPGKPLYRCSGPRCLLECTPISYMTIAPTHAPSQAAAPTSAPPAGPRPPPPGRPPR